jgi:phosphoglucomutase
MPSNEKIKAKTLPKNPLAVKTIVSTELCQKIADDYGCTLVNVLTGFKFIGEQITILEESNEQDRFILGFEESYGYLPADFLRDKDAVAACALMAEMTAWAKDNGMSIFELIQEVYLQFGYGKEKGISVVRKGKSGAEEIQQMMKDFRANPPKEIAGSKVVVIKDYQTLVERNVATGEESKLAFPTTSNVLQYFTEDGTKVSVRPSGTEPKIKFYIEVRGKMESRADYARCEAEATAKVDAVRASLGV